MSSKKKEPPPRDYRSAVPVPDEVRMEAIGVVRSPYLERHGTPRQPVIRGQGREEIIELGQIVLFPDRVPEVALRDLAGFERIWVLSVLHLNKDWAPLVRPPRGGVKRGVFATRSPHHPNRIGLSCVVLDSVEGHVIHVRGLDLIDGTPILDIKPYVPYCDAFADSSAGWVEELEALDS